MEALQEKLGELAARSAELAQGLGAVEASASSTPNPQQVLVPSAIDTRLIKQSVAFDRERSAPIARLRSGLCQCSQLAHGRSDGTHAQRDGAVDIAHSAK